MPGQTLRRFFHKARKRLRTLGLAIACVLATSSFGWSAEIAPLIFGVFPHLTPKQLVTFYRPMANALEIRLQRRILLYTANDYTTFVRRTRRGEYDILLTAPHLAWLASKETGYVPMLQYTRPVKGLLVVKADSPYLAFTEMRNRTIATADPIAVSVLATQTKLASHGLKARRDYQVVNAFTPVNAAMRVINGSADGAMLGEQPYNIMPAELRQQMRILTQTDALSSQIYLTHPRLPASEIQAVHDELLNFAHTPQGQHLIQLGGYGNMTDASERDIRMCSFYGLQAQEIIRTTP